MEKLTNGIRLIEFHRTVQRIILQKVEKFTMQEIFDNMLEKCDETVGHNLIREVILDVLDNFLNVGLIKAVIINESIGGYERCLATNVEQSI